MSKRKVTVDGTFKLDEFIDVAQEISETESLTFDQITTILRDCIDKAYRDYRYPTNPKNAQDLLLKTVIDLGSKKGKIKIYECKNIVPTDDDIVDDFVEIDLESAKKISKKAKVGELLMMPVDVEEFLNDQIVIRKISQSFRQKLIEASKRGLLDTYQKQIGQILTGEVEKIENDNVIINFGKTTSILTRKNIIPGERFEVGQKNVLVYLEKVGEQGHQARLIISRTCDGFVKKLLEREVHEIYDGSVVIKNIARKPGVRSKVVVCSTNPNIDAVGSCVGFNSGRNTSISNYLNGEKIDIIKYEENPELMIVEALKPCNIVGIKMPTNKDDEVIVVCNNGERKTAIGIGGVNVLLASKLCNCKIKVMETDEAMREGVDYKTEASIRRELVKPANDYSTKFENIDDEDEEEYSSYYDSNIKDLGNSYKDDEIEESFADVTQPTEKKAEPNLEKQTKVEPTEEKVEITQVAKRSIEELEKMIDSEKNNKKQQTPKKPLQKEKKVEIKKETIEDTKSNVTNLPIYTDEEIDDYDDYEDDDIDSKYEYSEEDEDYDEYYNK